MFAVALGLYQAYIEGRDGWGAKVTVNCGGGVVV
jgi:hypothetical protein